MERIFTVTGARMEVHRCVTGVTVLSDTLRGLDPAAVASIGAWAADDIIAEPGHPVTLVVAGELVTLDHLGPVETTMRVVAQP